MWLVHACKNVASREKLRPEVLAFARLMESRLRRHDEDRGDTWRVMTHDQKLQNMEDELYEVVEAAEDDESEPTIKTQANLASECADLANYCMFLAVPYTPQEEDE